MVAAAAAVMVADAVMDSSSANLQREGDELNVGKKLQDLRLHIFLLLHYSPPSE